MDRRDYLRSCGIAAAGSVGVAAGCLGFGSSSSSAPPRKSKVIDAVAVSGNQLVVEPYGEKWVMSGRDISLQSVAVGRDVVTNALGALLPVGGARAQKGGGGGSRNAAAASRTSRGRLWFGADDDDDDWYENNQDKIKKVPVVLGAVGVAYIGTDIEEQDPGPGPLDWDEQFDNPDGTVASALLGAEGAGWYRVGSEVSADPESVASGEGVDLGWESLDLRVQNVGNGPSITERWKVSPTITT